MNELVIPPSPNWYENDILVCPTDKILIYGACKYLVVIKHSQGFKNDDIKFLRAHNNRVVSINVNPKWDNPYKYAVTTGEDKIVKLWDMNELKEIKSHSRHTEFHKSKLIGATFAGDNKIVSVSEKGELFVWKFINSELISFNILCETKVTVTCLSVCPHASWLAAFGLKTGLIVVADLRKEGQVIFKLRGHTERVVSLTWCPAPVNIFPVKPCSTVLEKKSNDEEVKNEPIKVNKRKQETPKKISKDHPDDLEADKSQDECENSTSKPSLANRKKGKKTLSEIVFETNGSTEICDSIKQMCGISSVDSSDHNSVTLTETLNNSENNIELTEEPRKEFLLASSSFDENVYIWRAGTDGRMQTFINIPNKKKVKMNKNGRSENKWIAICWAAPHILLTSSKNDELLSWTLPKPLDDSRFMRVIRKEHWNALFTIKAPLFHYTASNFMQERDINVWSTGMERLLLNSDVKTREILNSYPTLGGYVHCIVSSPLDPSRLAIGTGEGVIHIWNLRKEKTVVFKNLYEKMRGAISYLAWHPENEFCLAWGTVEGKVGVFSNFMKKKVPYMYADFFKVQILKIEWGPLNGTDVKGLYVVSNGGLVVYSGNESRKDAVMMPMPDNQTVYTIAWKLDFSLLLVSANSGRVFAYDKNLQLLHTSYFQHKLQAIVWHPDSGTSDTTIAGRCNTFAGMIQSKKLVVYTFNLQAEGCKYKVQATFTNSAVINCITWSPHSGGDRLVFIDQSVAQVFDINSETILATYLNEPFDDLMTICWSPMDPDLIISGTRRQRIIVWRLSENPALSEQDISSFRKKFSKPGVSSTARKPEKKSGTNSPAKRHESILPIYYSENCCIKDVKKLLDHKLGKLDSKPTSEESEVDVLDIFGDTSGVNVVDMNIKAFHAQEKLQNGDTLSLFKGDFNEVVKEAILQKRVTPWLISLAPMVSSSLWQKACETYVQQLKDESNSNPIEVVTYLLACHRVEEAVEYLCDSDMFKEAIILAKTRLGHDSPLVVEVFHRFAKFLISKGHFEMAGLSFVAIRKYQEAATILYRRSSLEILELALELARLSENSELCEAVENSVKSLREQLQIEKNKLFNQLDEIEQAKHQTNGKNTETMTDNLFNLLDEDEIKEAKHQTNEKKTETIFEHNGQCINIEKPEELPQHESQKDFENSKMVHAEVLKALEKISITTDKHEEQIQLEAQLLETKFQFIKKCEIAKDQCIEKNKVTLDIQISKESTDKLEEMRDSTEISDAKKNETQHIQKAVSLDSLEDKKLVGDTSLVQKGSKISEDTLTVTENVNVKTETNVAIKDSSARPEESLKVMLETLPDSTDGTDDE